MTDIIQCVRRTKDLDTITALVLAEPRLLDDLIETMLHDTSSLKYRCEKVVRAISESNPEQAYPHFDRLIGLLDADNNFLKWGTIGTIANLAAVDSRGKFDALFDRYYAFVAGPDMVAAAGVIGNSWKIALAKPRLASRIVERMLAIQKARYLHKGKLSPECRDVVIGAAIDSFAEFYGSIEHRQPVIAFVKKQRKNSRPQVAAKARKFLKRFAVA
ncbi:MAG: hypothetical protein GYA46_05870 [candidate division Zixibacteria bacterium]|nr:hypothetical protein [candidate division Zixibacteria bacterium]